MNLYELSTLVNNMIYNTQPYIPMIEFMETVHIHKIKTFWHRSLILYMDNMYNNMIKSIITPKDYYDILNNMYCHLQNIHNFK